VTCDIWNRKELESFLLDAKVVARVTGADENWIEDALAAAAEEAETEVFAQVSAQTIQEFRKDKVTQAVTEGKKRFDALWRDRSTRKWVSPPERVLAGLNRRLSSTGHRTTSFRELARRFEADDVPAEMVAFLDRIEGALEEAGVPGSVK
jgi:hypothetical protein